MLLEIHRLELRGFEICYQSISITTTDTLSEWTCQVSFSFLLFFFALFFLCVSVWVFCFLLFLSFSFSFDIRDHKIKKLLYYNRYKGTLLCITSTVIYNTYGKKMKFVNEVSLLFFSKLLKLIRRGNNFDHPDYIFRTKKSFS